MMSEQQKHPMQLAFEQNLRFLNQESYPLEFFQDLFQPSEYLQTATLGVADFPTGRVVLADPLCYLGSKYETTLEQQIALGSYPVQAAVLRTRYAGLRYAAARLLLAERPAASYEIAMPLGYQPDDLGKPGVFSFFGVDAGLACFADAAISAEYAKFETKWRRQNPNKNIYDDYFAALFAKSYAEQPAIQREGGHFICWQLPESGARLVMFSSGLGDGVYSAYWGVDAEGLPVELVIPFMNPEFFI